VPARAADPLLSGVYADIQARTRAGLEEVEAALAEAVASADPFVQEAASHLLEAGGKRFRPTLVFLAGHFGDPTDHRLVGAAVAIELTHLSTLYHDDVMDEAEIRRGARSANARYDNKIAILTGDYLFARASEVTAGLGAEATLVLARAIARLVEGQIRESRGPAPGQDPVEHYMGVLTDKTGALIAAACRLGGRLAGASAAEVDALTQYGERIGVAFQLGDDLLDIATETVTSGKLPGMDLLAGVRTLPVLYLLRRGGPDAERLARVLDGERDDDALATALTLLRSSPAFAEARQAAQVQADRAKAALGPVPPGPARSALEEVADRVLDRET
jgi:heptaprenyl diphosphate synthase